MLLSSNLLAMLSAQYAHEISNSMFYSLLGSWASMRGLTGTAKLCAKQAEGEIAHAKSVIAYIDARNEQMVYAALLPPGEPPSTFLDMFKMIQERERATTEAIIAIQREAGAENDFVTSAWLFKPDGLLLEQIEEENLAQTILDRIAARMGNIPMQQGTEVMMASEEGAAIHDIDVWIGGMA